MQLLLLLLAAPTSSVAVLDILVLAHEQEDLTTNFTVVSSKYGCLLFHRFSKDTPCAKKKQHPAVLDLCLCLSLHFSSETVVKLVPVYCCCCHCSDPFFLLHFRLFKTKRRLLDTLTYYKHYYLVIFPSPSVQGFLCNKPSMRVISSSLL